MSRFAVHRLHGVLAARPLLVAAVLAMLLGTGGAPAWAQQPQTLELGALRIPPPTGYVNDFAQILTRAQWQELEGLCRGIDRQTGVQIALVIMPSLEGEPVTDVRTRLFEHWRVGRAGEDRGLLILHALEERRIEVETGYGLEGILPDARVGAILDEAVMPHFRDEQFFAGYRAGLVAFARHLAGDPDARSGTDAYRTGDRSGARGRGFPLGTLLLVPLLLYLLIRHPRLLLLLLLMNMGGRRSGGGMGGGFGGGFGGFGGGMSGGGGAGRSY